MQWQTVQDQIAESTDLRRALTLATVCRAVAVRLEEERYAASLEKVGGLYTLATVCRAVAVRLEGERYAASLEKVGGL